MEAAILLSLSILVVFISSLLFVNSIEYVADLMKWSHTFTGAVIAPVFTSIPELFIFVVAVFIHGGHAGSEIGLGLIFGEPFMTSSISYFLVLLAVLLAVALHRIAPGQLSFNRSLRIPFLFVFVLFPLVLVPGIVHVAALQYAMGALFIALYVLYIRTVMGEKKAEIHPPAEEPLINVLLDRRYSAFIQLALSAVLLYFGSNLMIDSIEALSSGGLSPLSLSIIVIPVATAIPETLSAMIWAFRGRNSLAVGSIVGEKVLYATFYPGIAMLMIPWLTDTQIYISVAGTTLVSAFFYLSMRRGRMSPYALAAGLPFFLLYVLIVFAAL